MFFASDNAGPVHPAVLEALTRANDGYRLGYGADAEMDQVRGLIRETFEAPEAAVYLVGNGTAANALILATLGAPWQTAFCHEVAHIQADECNAPEFYSDGMKLTPVPGSDAKMTPDLLRAAIAPHLSDSVHVPQAGPISITQVTERGTLYTCDEIAAIGDLARQFNLPLHLDGARFGNALVALGCSPAEMTWKAGVDAVSFGGTKNGLMGVEAVVFFDPARAREFELRRKRGGHLSSKHRYLSAQMLAYLQGDLWLDLARQANAAAARLARGLRQIEEVTLLHEPQANMIFARLPQAMHTRLEAAGGVYYKGSVPGDPLSARLVCDWSCTEAATDAFLAAAR